MKRVFFVPLFLLCHFILEDGVLYAMESRDSGTKKLREAVEKGRRLRKLKEGVLQQREGLVTLGEKYDGCNAYKVYSGAYFKGGENTLAKEIQRAARAFFWKLEWEIGRIKRKLKKLDDIKNSRDKFFEEQQEDELYSLKELQGESHLFYAQVSERFRWLKERLESLIKVKDEFLKKFTEEAINKFIAPFINDYDSLITDEFEIQEEFEKRRLALDGGLKGIVSSIEDDVKRVNEAVMEETFCLCTLFEELKTSSGGEVTNFRKIELNENMFDRDAAYWLRFLETLESHLQYLILFPMVTGAIAASVPSYIVLAGAAAGLTILLVWDKVSFALTSCLRSQTTRRINDLIEKAVDRRKRDFFLLLDTAGVELSKKELSAIKPPCGVALQVINSGDPSPDNLSEERSFGDRCKWLFKKVFCCCLLPEKEKEE